ncbi:MAG: aminotransferase class I/II-fold pyridoxal phosphate-dependent enzyme, partial [Acidimicrobiales bacterium]
MSIGGAGPGKGFTPPPYPYDRLAAVAELAEAVPGGMVDLSVGTPCDPPADAVMVALASSGTERGYPTSVGSPALRQAVVRYLERRFGIDIDPALVAACVGTKEFVASAAWYLRLRSPERDTVLGPPVAYPTYAMSAQLAGCRYVAVPASPGGGLDLEAVSAAETRRALAVWVNSPNNPTGALDDLAAAAAWGRAHDVPVLCDECYVEFTWAAPPASILEHGSSGVLAVHSLSKMSNLAGARVGFYAGDAELVAYLSEVRKHAGLMVPGPVQAGAVAALDDDAHVAEQRERYRRRLELLAAGLRGAGLDARMPAGTFYLWVPVPPWASELGALDGRGGAWVLAEVLARAAGVLVSPGDLYGEAGSGFVRMAVVAPDDRIALVVDRLAAGTDRRLRAGASVT